MKRLLLVLLMIVMTSTGVMAKSESVVSLGADLNDSQRTQILSVLNADEDVRIIETTNREERKYLGDHVDSKLIGNRAMSSASVEILTEGSGIEAEVYNVTWVTKQMVKNAVATAGITDAKVKVAAPFNVSGTAGLTGIIKAFEDVTGEKVNEKQKEVANEEIAKTGELGQDIGKDEASDLIQKVKEEIVEKDIKNKDDIEVVIKESADELNITLTDEQKETISKLMEKISRLDLNVDVIKSQIKNISDKVGEIAEDNGGFKSLFQKIIDFVINTFNKIFNKVDSEMLAIKLLINKSNVYIH